MAMAPYTIRLFGDPVLKQRAAEVTDIDGALARLADDMLETIYDAHGAGLAAPQVGVQKRLFVYDIDDDPIVIVNPIITETRGEWTTSRAACRSPASTSRSCGPRRSCSPATTSTATSSRSRPTSSRPGCSSTSSTTSTGVLLLEHLDEDQRKEARKALREMALAVPEPVTPHLGLGTR